MFIGQARSIQVCLVALPLMRWGLERLLQTTHPQFEVVGAAATPDEAFPMLESKGADVVVLDMEGSERTEPLARLSTLPRLKVLLITGSVDVAWLDKAVLAGVRGVVRKGEPPATLLKAIEKVHEGELWIDRGATSRIFMEMARQKASDRNDPDHSKIATLTVRERQTIVAVASDASAPGKVIAGRLVHQRTHAAQSPHFDLQQAGPVEPAGPVRVRHPAQPERAALRAATSSRTRAPAGGPVAAADVEQQHVHGLGLGAQRFDHRLGQRPHQVLFLFGRAALHQFDADRRHVCSSGVRPPFWQGGRPRRRAEGIDKIARTGSCRTTGEGTGTTRGGRRPRGMTLIAILLATLAAGIGSVWLAAGLMRLGLPGTAGGESARQVGPPHLLSLAAGALLATAFMHLLPEAFESGAGAKGLFTTLLVGLVFFFLLDKAELWHHGHEHHQGEAGHEPAHHSHDHHCARTRSHPSRRCVRADGRCSPATASTASATGS